MAIPQPLVPSPISPPTESWVTSPKLSRTGIPITPDTFIRTAEFLLENVNINTRNLLRADILSDSLGVLKTPEEKEKDCARDVESEESVIEPNKATGHVEALPARDFPSFQLKRTVVRRFIPRNAGLDNPLDQTCHFYEDSSETSNPRGDRREEENHSNSKRQGRYLVTYSHHCFSQEGLPYYHPSLRSLALLLDFEPDLSEAKPASKTRQGTGSLSMHFLPYPPNPPTSNPKQLQQTLLTVLKTHIRLSQGSSTTSKGEITAGPKENPFKDNLIPQHIVQNTYTRLKMTYSTDLINKWVEKTEPSKHVYEDLAIVAFLIELWRGMYGVKPLPERDIDETGDEKNDPSFPGFVDIACGNGLLVYILLKEGYWGHGFDARRRKTWSIFPESIQAHLTEALCIPKPFKDLMDNDEDTSRPEMESISGIFAPETFIISNHADELTLWTPLLATLSNPESPLPFLAIPCCSHSLSGVRYRFPPPRSKLNKIKAKEDGATSQQPSSGDLKSLRASKIEAQTDYNSQSHITSTYGCLTAKVIEVTEEIGIEAEKTRLRIPSTRNIGVIGGRRRGKDTISGSKDGGKGYGNAAVAAAAAMDKVRVIIERECSRDGGVDAAAEVWAKRALSLHKGRGRGKVNWGRKISHDLENEEVHPE